MVLVNRPAVYDDARRQSSWRTGVRERVRPADGHRERRNAPTTSLWHRSGPRRAGVEPEPRGGVPLLSQC